MEDVQFDIEATCQGQALVVSKCMYISFAFRINCHVPNSLVLCHSETSEVNSRYNVYQSALLGRGVLPRPSTWCNISVQYLRQVDGWGKTPPPNKSDW